MPFDTFLNLPDNKKQGIEMILLNIFFEKPISQVKVSEVVREMKMSRGAFYQYFSDLEDAYSYTIEKYAFVIHQDIMIHINNDKNQFFKGIEKYLIWCSELQRDSPYFKSIQLLTKSNDLSPYKRPDFTMDSPMISQWTDILTASGIIITDNQEAISFLYFIMEIVMNALTAYVANNWSTAELITDYHYRVKWITHGLQPIE